MKCTISSKLSFRPVPCLANNQRHPLPSCSLHLCFLSCLQPAARPPKSASHLFCPLVSPATPGFSFFPGSLLEGPPYPLIISTGVLESDELRPYTREKKLSRAQNNTVWRSSFPEETGPSIYEDLLDLTPSRPVISATKMPPSLVQTCLGFLEASSRWDTLESSGHEDSLLKWRC